MSIIYVLIPIAILLVILAIAIFFWAVKSSQFDDLERQGYSILFDDDVEKQKPSKNAQRSNPKELNSNNSTVETKPQRKQNSNE